MYEQILAQLQDLEFPDEEDFDGQDVENSYLRRLYRILNLPTGDWVSRDDVMNRAHADKLRRKSLMTRFVTATRKLLGLGHGLCDPYRAIGFKSVLQKSVHFKSSRFRESLMELSMLCHESQLMSFVENMEDLETLFASMTPVVERFFENSFTTTAFTKRIKNLNWKLGDQLEVIGK